jgi:glycosyltransferase involved in cell wall biosynthesis/peptidoglycan biosynthesis protein MviN/MurJ (putative lipid II flippase)
MRKTLTLGLLSSLNLIILFVYQWYFVRHLGAGNDSDVIFAGQIIPDFIYSLLASTLIHVMVPHLSSLSKEDKNTLIWTVITNFFMVIIPICLFLNFFSHFWLRLLFPGFTSNELLKMQEILPFLFLQIMAHTLTSILVSKFYAEAKFAIIEILLSLGIFIGLVYIYFIGENLNVKHVVIGFTFKAIIPLLYLIPKLGFKYHYDKTIWNNFWQSFKPLFSGSLFYRSEPLLDRSLSTLIAPGSLTLIAMSRQIYGAGEKMVNKTIKNPLLLKFSQLANQQDFQKIDKLMNQRIIFLSLFLFIFAFILYVFGIPIIKLIFEYQQFTNNEVQLFHSYLMLLILYFVGSCLGQITSTVFYAIKDTKTPAILGSILFSMTIVLKFLGVKHFQGTGLILATGFYYFSNFFIGLLILKRKLKSQHSTTSSKTTNKKPIILLNNISYGGGAERSMTYLANGLSELGIYDITYVTLEKTHNPDLKSDIKQIAFRDNTKNFRLFKVFDAFFDAIRLVKIIKETDAKIVLSFQHRSNIINVLAKIFFGRHFAIISERNYTEVFFKNSPISLIIEFFIKWFYQRADFITCNAKDIKTSLSKYFSIDENKIKVINNGYPIDEIKLTSQGELDLEDQWLFQTNKTKIITIGRLVKQKGHEYLIRAFHLLPNKNDFRLFIIGEGPEQENLEKLIEELNLEKHIYLFGYKNNAIRYLSRSDLFVFPSLFEGYPNALSEALIVGIPIISFDFKAGAREILHDGKFGKLIPLKDIEQLANSILKNNEKPQNPEIPTFESLIKNYQTVLNSFKT